MAGVAEAGYLDTEGAPLKAGAGPLGSGPMKTLTTGLVLA